jgi:transcriptional regulator with XRE-family HTH domain
MDRTDEQLRRGNRIRLALKKAGLSHALLAEEMGCSRQLVGTWVAGGTMNVDQLAQLCLLAKCTPTSILYGEPPAEIFSGDGSKNRLEAPAAEQFGRLDPWLRDRLWPLYQVFVRPGAPDRAGSPC